MFNKSVLIGKMSGCRLKRKLLFIIIFLGFLLFPISVFVVETFGLVVEEAVHLGSLPENKISLTAQDIIKDVSDFVVKSGNISIFLVSISNDTISLIEEMPSSALIVKLPNNRVGIKLSDDCSDTKLYNWKSIVEANGSYLINIDEDTYIISPYKPIDLQHEFNLLFSNTSFHQSINKLDEYKVSAVFTSTDAVITGFVKTVSINWGDDTLTDANLVKAEHTYRRSGTYPLTFVVVDCFGITHKVIQNYTVNYEGDLHHLYLLVKEYKEPVATVSVSFTAFAAFIFLTETGKFKFFAFLSLLTPLFTRVQKDDVLDQFVRGEIYGYVKTNPGATYNEIMQKLGLKNGTLSYHLHMLEKMEMIKSRLEGIRYRAFYPTGMRFPEEEQYRLTELQLRILKTVKENEGITQREIAKKLDRKPQTINYNVRVLQQAGLLKVRKLGRRTICYILKEIGQNKTP